MSTKIWCILALALTVLSSATSVAAAVEVSLIPEQSNVSVGTDVAIEIWVNATEFKSGQINLTYDSGCVNVTNLVLNETNFPMSGWSHYEGSEWITFMATEQSLTGFYQIGTLTVQCVNDTDCGTRLEFDEASEKRPSKLYGAKGSISVDWQTGRVECAEASATADGGTHEDSTAADTGEAEDTNVTSDAKNETVAPVVNKTAANETAINETAVNETAANVTLQTPPAQEEPEVSPEIAEPEPEHTPATQTPSSTPKSSSVHMIVALAVIIFTAVIISLRRCKK